MDAIYTLTARNTALASNNKIHDDTVARRFGFRGGLVPGVDVYAYLAHLPAARWGIDWLEHGSLEARFHAPVYDGDAVTVVADDAADGLSLTLTTGAAEARATGAAALASPSACPVDVPVAPMPGQRPPASPETLAPGTVLGTLDYGFHADKAPTYLDEVGEALPLFRNGGVAHPGWLMRTANYVLADSVVLGPWIHVSSAVRHHGVVRDGDRLQTRARVAEHFERKGHKFVALDVLVVAGSRPILRAAHTAIYEPRHVSAPAG